MIQLHLFCYFLKFHLLLKIRTLLATPVVFYYPMFHCLNSSKLNRESVDLALCACTRVCVCICVCRSLPWSRDSFSKHCLLCNNQFFDLMTIASLIPVQAALFLTYLKALIKLPQQLANNDMVGSWMTRPLTDLLIPFCLLGQSKPIQTTYYSTDLSKTGNCYLKMFPS